jgi:PAS domain S-box-containing protein
MSPACRRVLIPFLLLLLLAAGQAWAETKTIRIGVLSHRGEAATLFRWTPTAEYLSYKLPDYRFTIVPLNFAEVTPAVAGAQVDFVLVNPGIYVNLEVHYRVSRIATLNNRRGDDPLDRFGGVIFTRADRRDIRNFQDLRGRSFMAVDQTSLGGFQMAWRELHDEGVNPYRDFSRVYFAGIHDRVVHAVLGGKVDAGTVRTNILERMAAAGEIDLDDIKVIHPRHYPGFPFRLSTRLYPEWPFSKVRHTSDELAQKVALALLGMPHDHAASINGLYAGWNIPLDYQPVHDLFRELELPPYEPREGFTLWDALQRYWSWVLLGLAILLVLGVLTLRVTQLNRRLQRAKQRLEREHQLILDSVADGIYGVDMEGNSTFVNRAMEQITGWRAGELIGRNQHELLHHTRADGSHHPPQECPVYGAYRDNRTRFIDDDLFWKKDGNSFPVEYTATPIRDEQGRTMGSVVVFRDITERKQAEEETQRHQREMAHVARLSTLGEMASGIAHELNQPLTAINTNARACVRMLESGRSPWEQCADVMERIAAQAERAGEVIRQIRRFIRKEEPESRPVRVGDLVRNVVGMVRHDANREGVRIQLELEPNDDWVVVQQIQIEQVLLNLARNAIEAMGDTTRERRLLTIGSHRDGQRVRLTVSDTGPGLSPEVADRAFDPFVTTKPNGMGLGLSISAGIIENHGGQLSVRSNPGEGAEFSFTLLRTPNPADNAQTRSTARERTEE